MPEELALKPSISGEPPSGRLGQLYLDTASYHPASLRAAIDTVGVERLVLGTDYPPAGRSPKPTIDLVESLGLSDEDRDRILGGNAARASRPFRHPRRDLKGTTMATSTTDIQTTVNNYIADLNEAAQTRAFPFVIMKWFGPEGRLNFHNETHGREGALQVWGHMLPTGEKVRREVTQVRTRSRTVASTRGDR